MRRHANVGYMDPLTNLELKLLKNVNCDEY
jgi:hypothetical protein